MLRCTADDDTYLPARTNAFLASLAHVDEADRAAVRDRMNGSQFRVIHVFRDELAQGKGHAILGVQEVRSRLELFEIVDGLEIRSCLFAIRRNW